MTLLVGRVQVPISIPVQLCILSRFWDIQRQRMAWPWNRG